MNYKCINCNKELDEMLLTTIQNDYYCEECKDKLFFVCVECGDYEFKMHSCETPNGDLCCESCYDDIYSVCNGCGEVCLRDELHHCGVCEENFCSNCECHHDDDYYSEDENDSNDKFSCMKIPFKKEESNTFLKNRFKNFVGVEIECNGDDFYFQSQNELEKYGFSQIEDGSLSANGVEYVSNAFSGDLLLKKIETFCKKLNKENFTIDSSCGLHIHIGVKKSLNLIKKMLIFYEKYEDYFYNMVSLSRRDNNYCKSLDFEYNLSLEDILNFKKISDFEKSLYDSDDKTFIQKCKKVKYYSKRYAWLNLHSLFYRDTIEIRLHQGTINAKKINNWCLIHLSVIDFLEKHTIEDIINLSGTKKTFLSLFDRKLKNYIMKRWLDFDSEFKNKALKDFMNSQENIIFSATLNI